MMKIFILIIFLFVSGCSTTHVNVHKTVFVFGFRNDVKQGGSSLKDLKLDQKSDGAVKVPLVGG